MRKSIKNFFFFFIIILLSGFIIMSGCVHYPEVINDIRNLKQDTQFYLDGNTSDDELLTPNFQKAADIYYNKQYYLPWHKEEPGFSREEISWGFRKYSEAPGYGENKRSHSKEWIEALQKLANLEDYPNTHLKAITIKDTDLRILPTNKPFFIDIEKPGQGYPFDMLQNSAVWANTPILVSHFSTDGSWVFAEAPFAIGWISINDIAFVDEEFIRKWEGSDCIALIKDNVPIYDDASIFRFFGHIGSLFPKIDESNGHFECMTAITDIERKALIKYSKISKEYAVIKPFKVTQRNISCVADEFLNQPYGWGGMYGNRDCSATIRDLFTPFGIWLPRNSQEQAKAGMYISLKDFAPYVKEKMIMENGIPFGTLLWKKGHIMLYIGSHNNRVMILHNLWGLKTKSSSSKEGRKIVGHTAITTLQPGAELAEVDSEQCLLNTIEGMTFLMPPKSVQKYY